MRDALSGCLIFLLLAGGIVLLGEVHDNETQHVLRGDLIKATVAKLAEAKKQRPPALVFEHIRIDQAAALDPRPAPSPQGARELLDRLDWDKSGWTSPLGASGHPGSAHYADQVSAWAEQKLYPMRYSWDRVEADASARQTLEPA